MKISQKYNTKLKKNKSTEANKSIHKIFNDNVIKLLKFYCHLNAEKRKNKKEKGISKVKLPYLVMACIKLKKVSETTKLDSQFIEVAIE